MQALDLKPKRTLRLKMRMDDGELRDLDESCVKQRLGMSDSPLVSAAGDRPFHFKAMPCLDASEHVAPVLNDGKLPVAMPVQSEMVAEEFGLYSSEVPDSTALVDESE